MSFRIVLLLCILNCLLTVRCGYPPTGDEVVAGSVLLPASRRGRYLANIVRRQAVDGTGIKFNKDADRMNAEAKKKVDVLSEELLPYIIAEQERRTTLYKRVMTAIQNGEKGVTIAEIRNKPPLLIRRGLMYRCPSNRAPKEPDGSGVLMCEDDIDPTPVMYDSCLSAEDKDLYVAENKYFFCNRHKIEGPDLPRNGSTVIGCAPSERTSLNYTTKKCTLEDTDDVVVHYRYYPDKTYKYVSELDPDREVCDHWNPCQIGYIYSLPSPDQAQRANELWIEKFDDYERDEIVKPIPEDKMEENVNPSVDAYVSSRRRLRIPNGYKFLKLMRSPLLGDKTDKRVPADQYTRVVSSDGKWLTIIVQAKPKSHDDHFATYKAVFTDDNNAFKETPVLVITRSSVSLQFKTLQVMPGISVNESIPFKCRKCVINYVTVRGADNSIFNLENSQYKISAFVDSAGHQQKMIDFSLESVKPQDIGDYFAILENDDGIEERVKALTLEVIQLTRKNVAAKMEEHVDDTLTYTCDKCTLTDVVANGESAVKSGRAVVIAGKMMININCPAYEDKNSGVYMGFFDVGDIKFKKILAVYDTTSVQLQPKVIESPTEGALVKEEIPYTCEGDCIVEKVTVNGAPVVLAQARRYSTPGNSGYYFVVPSAIHIQLPAFSDVYAGVYQAVFNVGGETITKTIMEIKEKGSSGQEPATTAASAATTDAGAENTTVDSTGTSAESDSSAGDGSSTTGAAGDGSSTTGAAGDGSSTTGAAGDSTAAPGEASSAAPEEASSAASDASEAPTEAPAH